MKATQIIDNRQSHTWESTGKQLIPPLTIWSHDFVIFIIDCSRHLNLDIE